MQNPNAKANVNGNTKANADTNAKTNVKHEYVLEGLDCANCALKVENGVKKIPGVSSCTVNFMTRTLSLETTAEAEESVLEQTARTVRRLEPGIKLQVKNRSRAVPSSLPGTGKSGPSSPQRLDANVALENSQSHAQSHSQTPIQNHGHAQGHEQTHARGQVHEQNLEHAHGHSDDLTDEPSSGHSSSHSHDHSHDHSHAHGQGEGLNKTLILRLVAGAVIAAAGMLGSFSGVLEFVLFGAAYLIIGGDIVLRALKNIVRGQVFDEYFLMSVATLGAFAIRQFPEGVAVMLFYQIGELFQSLAVNRSRKSITSLINIRPEYANLKDGGEIRRVRPEEVGIGSLIIVKPGEKVPLDGQILEGNSMVDTSALTGESVPREVQSGSPVLAGFINKNGVLTVEVSKLFGESSAAKILELVENASSKKAPTENFITKFARYYTPFVVIVAVLLAVVPPLFLGWSSFSDWLYRALIFLVISCPCALVVSIPLGFFGGIGSASRQGVLVKGSNYLEALNAVKYVVFDKTGTLTKGSFQVTGIFPEEGWSKDKLLEYAAYAELHSNHPIAESIRNAYKGELEEHEVGEYNEISGHGVEVFVKGKKVLAGNAKLMQQNNISAAAQPKAAGTVVHLAVDGRYAGYLVISDELKADAAAAVQALKELGVKKTVMLTGDIKSVADSVAEQLKIDEVYSELLPEDKVSRIEALDELKLAREKIVFVGDGINDTPVLARADIGIAMGGLGSDAAIEAADIVIMNDEPSKIAAAIRTAKRTRRIVWQNIIFALGVKAVFLVLGAFGIATMWEAVFSDVGVTVIAVANAMRVLRSV